MLRHFSLAALLAAAFLPFAANAQFKYGEGTDFRTLPEALETTEAPKVIEFFWFGCSHCNSLRPFAHEWIEKELPEGAEFEFVPAYTASDRWQRPAQAYYTMQALKVDLFDAYFDEIFKNRNGGLLGSDKAVREFFVKNGVDGEAFDKAWNSFEVKQQLQRAKALFEKSGFDGVPAIVVNGKYAVNRLGSVEEGYRSGFDLINTLLKKK